MWTSLSRIPKPPLYPSLPQKAGSRRGMCSTAGFKAHRNPASFCIMQQNRIWKLYTKWISFLKNHKLPLSLKMLTEMLLNKPYKWASPLAWNASSASLPASPPFTHAHTHTHIHTFPWRCLFSTPHHFIMQGFQDPPHWVQNPPGPFIVSAALLTDVSWASLC